MKVPKTQFNQYKICDKTYVQVENIIEALKEDLLHLLSNPDEEMFASEYLKDRIQLWERALKAWKVKSDS